MGVVTLVFTVSVFPILLPALPHIADIATTDITDIIVYWLAAAAVTLVVGVLLLIVALLWRVPLEPNTP